MLDISRDISCSAEIIIISESLRTFEMAAELILSAAYDITFFLHLALRRLLFVCSGHFFSMMDTADWSPEYVDGISEFTSALIRAASYFGIYFAMRYRLYLLAYFEYKSAVTN